MRLTRRSGNEVILVVLLGLLTVAPVAMVRFLPVFDYPHWIYQAHVVANISDYREWFDLQMGPIPNLGSTLFLWPMSLLLGAELAGRVLTGLYAFSMVLAFYYLVRGLSSHSGLVFFGSVFTFNYFFYEGFLSFLLGLPVLLFTIGLSVRTRNVTPFKWITLTVLSVLSYLCHLFIWLPILAYTLIRVFFMVCTGDRRSSVVYGTTQLLPLALLVWYIRWRTSAETLSWNLYRSVSNKLFSLIAPLLPFSRTDPFPSVLPILALNAAFALVIGFIIVLALRLYKANPDRSNFAALLLTALTLIAIAALLPLEMFGGMGAVDQRFVFTGFLLLMACAGSLLPSSSRLSLAVVSIVVIGLQCISFVYCDRNLRTIHAALDSRTLGSPIHVAAFRRPPIYGECDPRIWDAGNGVFPLQWFPIFDIIERDLLDVRTFDTAIVVNRAGIPAVDFGEYETAKERQMLVDSLSTRQTLPYEYLVLVGCPVDIESVSGIWKSGRGEMVNRSTYHRLIRLR